MVYVAVDDFGKLESLGAHFAPSQVRLKGIWIFRYSILSACRLAKMSAGALVCVNRALPVSMENSYFEALQSLSPSRWILYESMTSDQAEGSGVFNRIWRPFVDGMAWKQICANSSIQITGPARYGKSAPVKLIS